MRKLITAGTIALMTLGAAPAFADSNWDKDPHALASDGIQSLLKAMEMMLLAIPQYEAPYVNENGDIIIRRKKPSREPARPSVPERWVCDAAAASTFSFCCFAFLPEARSLPTA